MTEGYGKEISYRLTKDQYNYLIAVPSMRKHLLNRAEVEEFYFVGFAEEICDMISRLRYL